MCVTIERLEAAHLWASHKFSIDAYRPTPCPQPSMDTRAFSSSRVHVHTSTLRLDPTSGDIYCAASEPASSYHSIYGSRAGFFFEGVNFENFPNLAQGALCVITTVTVWRDWCIVCRKNLFLLGVVSLGIDCVYFYSDTLSGEIIVSRFTFSHSMHEFSASFLFCTI